MVEIGVQGTEGVGRDGETEWYSRDKAAENV